MYTSNQRPKGEKKRQRKRKQGVIEHSRLAGASHERAKSYPRTHSENTPEPQQRSACTWYVLYQVRMMHNICTVVDIYSARGPPAIKQKGRQEKKKHRHPRVRSVGQSKNRYSGVPGYQSCGYWSYPAYTRVLAEYVPYKKHRS